MSQNHKKFKTYKRKEQVDTVVLHHTVTPTLEIAERVLKERGLGYHYIIDKEGQVTEYVKPDRLVYHAKGHNSHTVGVSFVCGGEYGYVNEEQINKCISLLQYLKISYPDLKYVTGHKHLKPSGRKIDPRWPDEPEDGVLWGTDNLYMKIIEKHTKLIFRNKDYYDAL